MSFELFKGLETDFVVEETATGRLVSFRLVDVVTKGPELERVVVARWLSEGLVDNFIVDVGTGVETEAVAAELIAAAIEQAKLELQEPPIAHNEIVA